MLMKWAFKYFSESKKVDYLKDQGIMLGSRIRQGRKVYIYMLKDFFVEVMYHQDNIDLCPEKLETFSNLNNLNSYLEREFRTAF
jgi:hypothetical protein